MLTSSLMGENLSRWCTGVERTSHASNLLDPLDGAKLRDEAFEVAKRVDV